MSSDNTAAASKQSTDDSTVGSGVDHGEISDPKTTGTGDGADTKDEGQSGHPHGESDTSSSRKEDAHDSATAEHEDMHYHPRGPPSRPTSGRPIKR